MAGIVKGNIGDQQVELNNAATESTLAAMLAIAKTDSAILREMARKAGVNEKAIQQAAAAMEKQGAAAAGAGSGLGSLAPKASLVGGLLMDMGQGVAATAKNLIGFGDELMEGKARASDFFKALKELPLGLGLLASVFQKAMQYQEKNLDVYREISRAGVGLTGSLTDLRTSASAMYLTLDEYTEVMKQNADVMTKLGGSATIGHKAFDGINRQLIQGRLGSELLNLGYTLKDVNNLLGNYLRISNDGIRVDKDSASEQRRLAESAARYGKELDFLSRLTGESREAKEAEMKQEQMEAAWQMELAKMAPEEREKAILSFQNAFTTGGKGAGDAMKASILGFAAPFSKEGKAFVSNMHTGAQVINEWSNNVKNKSIPVEQFRDKLHRDQAKFIAGNMKDLDGISNVIVGMGLGASDSSKGLMDVVTATNSFRVQNLKSEEQIAKVIKTQEELTKKNQAAAAAATANDVAMKGLGNLINIALAPVMSQLATYGTEVVKEFIHFTKNIDFEKVGNAIKDMMVAVVNYSKYLFSPEGRQKIITDIKNLFKELLIELKLAIVPWYTEGKATKDRLKIELDNKVAKAKADEAAMLEQNVQLQKNIAAKEAEEGNKKRAKELEAEAKAVNEDKKLSDEEKKQRLAKIEEEKKSIDKQLKLATNVDDLDKAKAEQSRTYKEYQELNRRHQMAVDEYNAKVVGDPKYRRAWEATKKREGITNDNYQTSYEPKRASGSLGATGRLIENFGKGTNAVLHGNEGVITESQLANLASGAVETGAGLAQEKLANAILALNKQQAMTNALLERISENTRRTSESSGRWGNAFARV